MKFLYSYKLLSIFYGFCMTFSLAGAQGHQAPAPAAIEIAHDARPIIYPLGWSTNGKFAYIVHDVNPLSGAAIYIYKFSIQNVRTSTIEWTSDFKYDFENNKPETYRLSPEDMEGDFFERAVWPNHKKEILENLKQHDISISSLPLNKMASLNEHNVTLTEEKAIANSKNDSPTRQEKNCVDHYKIILNRAASEVQDLYTSKKMSCNDTVWFRNFSMQGYFKNPSSNDIAILVFEITNGYEEPWEYPFFVGALIK